MLEAAESPVYIQHKIRPKWQKLLERQCRVSAVNSCLCDAVSEETTHHYCKSCGPATHRQMWMFTPCPNKIFFFRRDLVSVMQFSYYWPILLLPTRYASIRSQGSSRNFLTMGWIDQSEDVIEDIISFTFGQKCEILNVSHRLRLLINHQSAGHQYNNASILWCRLRIHSINPVLHFLEWKTLPTCESHRWLVPPFWNCLRRVFQWYLKFLEMAPSQKSTSNGPSVSCQRWTQYRGPLCSDVKCSQLRAILVKGLVVEVNKLFC